MNQQLKFSSILFGLTCALSACVALHAAALPGQSVEEVARWAIQHPLIPALMPSVQLQTGDPNLFSTSKCMGRELSFSVWIEQPPKAVVLKESVDYRSSDPSFDFNPKNSAGMNLIRQVYDAMIAEDLAASSLVYQGRGQTRGRSFYKGSRFAYITNQFRDRNPEASPQRRNIAQLTVVPLNQLDNEIQRDKKIRPMY